MCPLFPLTLETMEVTLKRAVWEIAVWSACRTLHLPDRRHVQCTQEKIEKKCPSLAIACPDRGVMNGGDSVSFWF